MTTLAFDTSTDILGICIASEERYFLYTACTGFNHSEELLSQIDHLYKSASIKKEKTDLILCAKGPGSFTGLRIGMAAAKGLSDGLRIPMISIPTLDILAESYGSFDGTVMPLLDAKSDNVFTAIYEKGKRLSDFMDIPKKSLPDLFKKYGKTLLTGSYAGTIYRLYNENKNLILDPDYNNCRIKSCVRIGEKLFDLGKIDEENSGPVYIRSSYAEIKK